MARPCDVDPGGHPPGGPRPRRRSAVRARAAALVATALLCGCGGGPGSLGSGMPPVCDPAPWADADMPRLLAPFDRSDDPAVAAAGLSAVPHLLNVEEVRRTIVQEFVPLMIDRDRAPAGEVGFWLRVESDGEIDDVVLDAGSGDEDVDRAARRVVARLALTPAVRDGCRVPVWVRYPIRFQSGGGRGDARR